MSLDGVAQSVEDCVVETEKEPLLGGGLEVVPSHGYLGEGEALGTAGGGEGVTNTPSEDSSGDLISKRAALGTEGRVGSAIMEVIPSKGIIEGEALGTGGGEGVVITDWVVAMGKNSNL